MNLNLVLMLLFVYGVTLTCSGRWEELFSVLPSERAQRVHGEWASFLHLNLPMFCSADLSSEVSNLLEARESSPGNLGISFREMVSF